MKMSQAKLDGAFHDASGYSVTYGSVSMETAEYHAGGDLLGRVRSMASAKDACLASVAAEHDPSAVKRRVRSLWIMLLAPMALLVADAAVLYSGVLASANAQLYAATVLMGLGALCLVALWALTHSAAEAAFHSRLRVGIVESRLQRTFAGIHDFCRADPAAGAALAARLRAFNVDFSDER